MNILPAVVVAALLLSGVVIWRIAAGRRKVSAESCFSDLGATLAELARTASPAEATRMIMDLLRREGGVERIIFLRKHRRLLQADMISGVPDEARREIRFQYQPTLVRSCTGSFSARDIIHLKSSSSDRVWQAIEAHEFNFCLPVFWKDHVYGLFLLKLPAALAGSTGFAELSALAQSLSAVYHLHWQSQPADSGLHGGGAVPLSPAPSGDTTRPARQILRLVRHRNSEIVVRKLISMAQSEIGLERFVCVYEPKDKTEELQLVAGGINRPVKIPGREAFAAMVQELSAGRAVDIKSLNDRFESAALPRELMTGGLSHALLFPLSAKRQGIFAWDDKKSAIDITRRLEFFHAVAADLVENAESFERVEELSQTDSLTGLYNQRYLQIRLAEEMNRARRYGRSLGLVMMDLDMLKAINDAHGHQAGDAILQQMGALLRSSVREIDVIARYGGDEFCVVMPEADLSTCEQFMTRIRTWLATYKFTFPGDSAELSCTVSAGAAVFPDHAGDPHKLVFAADMALLKAKERGRNTSQVYGRE